MNSMKTLLLIVLICITGCVDRQSDDLMARNAINTAEYHPLHYNQPISLINGQFHVQSPEYASQYTHIEINQIAQGDLNGDGVSDAAVILMTDGGGTGKFFELAAVLNNKGKLVHLTSIDLGDRVRIESIDIDRGKVLIKMLTHGPDDGLCCPSVDTQREYVLQGDKWAF